MGAKVDSRQQGGWVYLRRLLRPHARRLVAMVLASFVGSMLEAIFLVLITGIAMAIANGSHLVEVKPAGLSSAPALAINQVLTVCAALLVVRLLLAGVGAWLSAATSAAVLATQRRRLTEAFLDASWAAQQQESSGRLQGVLGFAASTTGVVNNVLGMSTAGLSLTAFLLTSFWVDPWATAFVLIGLLALAAIMVPLRRWIRRRAKIRAASALAFSQSIGELGSLGLEMQAFGVKPKFKAEVIRRSRRDARHGQAVEALSGSVSPVYISLAYAAVLAGIAVTQTMSGLQPAVLGAVMLLMLRSLSYGQQLQTQSVSLASGWPKLEEVERTIAQYEKDRASGGHLVPQSETPLRLTDVSYSYGEGRSALRDVTLTVVRGESIGVVGPSGSGKSTLVQLVLGLRPPTRGTVTVDGIDLRDVDRQWWATQVAMVSQSPVLLTGTVSENIRFFREGLSDDDLRRAAQQANILAEIEDLPAAFDTHLGQGGSQMSGGQRQRLSIARALAGSPTLLIMDEPTSALDGQSEALIKDTLARLKGKVTIIMIAHRLSTLDDCDRIVVIEGGEVTADAAPSEVLARSEYYRTIRGVAGLGPIATEVVSSGVQA